MSSVQKTEKSKNKEGFWPGGVLTGQPSACQSEKIKRISKSKGRTQWKYFRNCGGWKEGTEYKKGQGAWKGRPVMSEDEEHLTRLVPVAST